MIKQIKKLEKILAVILNYIGCIPIFLFFLLLPISNTYFHIFAGVFYLFVPFLYFCICRVKEEENLLINPIAIIIVWSLFFYVLEKEGEIGYSKMLTIASFIYLFLYVIYYYLKKLNRYIIYNKNGTDSIPIKRILTISVSIFLVCILSGAAVMLLVTQTGFVSYLMTAGWYVLRFIVFIFGSIFQLISFLLSWKTEGLGELQERGAETMLPANSEAGNNPILAVIAGIVILYFLVKVIARIIFALRRNSKKEELIKENIGLLKEEKVKKEKRTLPKVFFAASNNDKIRKIYYKVLYKKQPIQAGKIAPLEIEMLFDKEEAKAAALQLAILYEKARYSENSCSKQEVLEAKTAAGILGNSSQKVLD